MRIPTKKDYAKNWKSYENYEDAISIKQEGFEKIKTTSSGFYSICKKNNQINDKKLYCNFSTNIDEDNIIKINNDDEFLTIKDCDLSFTPVYENHNSKTFQLNVSSSIKKVFFLDNFAERIQNHVSLVLQHMCEIINIREKSTAINNFVRYTKSEKQDVELYNSIVEKLKNIFINTYVDDYIITSSDNKIKLKEHLKWFFYYYELNLKKKNSLFEIIVYKTANWAIFNKIISSSECLIIYYFPKCLIAKVKFELTSL